MAEPIEMPFGMLTRVDPRNYILDGPRSPYKGAIIRRKDMPRHARQHSVSCAKIAELVDLPLGLWTRVGRRKHKFNHILQYSPGGATCRIRLNGPSAVAVWPYVKLLSPLVTITMMTMFRH